MIQIINPEKILKKWGFELVLVNLPEFCSKILHYNKAGATSSFHFHPLKKEMFRINSGSFEFSSKDEGGNTITRILKMGDCIYIPNNCPHRLKALEDDSAVWEISTIHDDLDVVRIEPGDNQK